MRFTEVVGSTQLRDLKGLACTLPVMGKILGCSQWWSDLHFKRISGYADEDRKAKK